MQLNDNNDQEINEVLIWSSLAQHATVFETINIVLFSIIYTFSVVLK